MKAIPFMVFAALAIILPGIVFAQTPPAAPAPAAAAPLTPARIDDYKRRFDQGYALETQGKFAAARAIYDGILAEQPDARGSLIEAGHASLELNEPAKADVYLEKFHALEPDFPRGYELLIQANEALRKDVKADRLVREFRALRDSGRVPFKNPISFEREHIHLDQGAEIVITQFFDFTKPPYYVLTATWFGAGKVPQRSLLLKYDPDGTAALRQKDPKNAQAEFFILAEPVYSGDRMVRIDVYQEIFETPEYTKARNTMLAIFAHTPKTIYSAPVSTP